MNNDIYILMADDDPDDQLIMLDAFKRADAAIILTTVNDGEKLISHLLARQGLTLPRLIILDLNMPRMNGNEALEKIKANADLKNIPIIIFTSSLNPIEKAKAEKSGAKEFMIKPNTFDLYIETAKKFSMYCAA